MRQGLYCVYDSKVGLYAMPFFSVSDAAAARTFSDAVAQEGTLMGKHPEDFSLIRLADVEDSTGAVTSPVTPVEIINGRNVKAKETSNVRQIAS